MKLARLLLVRVLMLGWSPKLRLLIPLTLMQVVILVFDRRLIRLKWISRLFRLRLKNGGLRSLLKSRKRRSTFRKRRLKLLKFRLKLFRFRFRFRVKVSRVLRITTTRRTLRLTWRRGTLLFRLVLLRFSWL